MNENRNYVNVSFPPKFAHPYKHEDRAGKTWDKAIVNIPDGTLANGIDLSGYSVDVFLNDRQKSQIANGQSLTCGFPEGQKVTLFQGKGEERRLLEIDPWSLTKAVKAQRESYVAQKQTSLADRVSSLKETEPSQGLNEQVREASMPEQGQR
jgi:hypothetical protein